MRAPPPVNSYPQRDLYQENHSGEPWGLRVFMALCRFFTFWTIASTLLPLLTVWPPAIVAFTILWTWYNLAYTQVDIFFIVGFRLFSRLLGNPWR